MSESQTAAKKWGQRLREFLPGLLRGNPALLAIAPESSIILHGSTTRGIDNAHSDLDLWMVAPETALRSAQEAIGTRFVGFELDGKPAHINLENRREFAARVERCDMERIGELRLCEVLCDPPRWAQSVLDAARRPMRDPVRSAWFCYHYVEMRGDHRACDNPIERGDALAVLQALTPTLGHAMRAAMVLDREPYPYIKWLGTAASKTPTGARVVAVIEKIIDELGRDGLRHRGPEKEHPLGKRIREICAILTDAARASGIDEPWLERWWEFIERARDGVRAGSWQEERRW